MGRLFEHFEGYDVQEVRRQTREEVKREDREEMERLRGEAEAARGEAETARGEAEAAHQEARELREKGVRRVVEMIRDMGLTGDVAVLQLEKYFELSEADAREQVARYW